MRVNGQYYSVFLKTSTGSTTENQPVRGARTTSTMGHISAIGIGHNYKKLKKMRRLSLKMTLLAKLMIIN